VSYRGTETPYYDFTGGMASNTFLLDVKANEASYLRNVYLASDGGFEKRRGNTAFNASAMVGSTTAVTGLFYYKLAAGTQWLMAIAGTKIFKSDDLDGVMDDITGAVTITAGQDNMWTESEMNDIAIFVGGAPDAPIKWTGSGNAAVLAGSPPSGRFGFTHNNRFFIGNTTANPSTIYWSILGNPEDWSGTGSGNQDIEKNDGDTLVGAAPLNTNMVLLFKQNSVHQFLTNSAPFPYFPLFKGVGAVGNKAIVVADGIAYFITPQARMKSSDGSTVTVYPDKIDDVWDSLNKSRLQYIVGKRYTGIGFDHLIWLCSSGSSTTNNLAIVWDLVNKCWLQHTTGYKANAMAKTQSGVLYTGHYNGKIYKQDVDGIYSDASEGTIAIDGYWRSGFGFHKSIERSLQLSRINVGFVSRTSGFLNVGHGFNFNVDQYNTNINMQSGGAALWNSAIWGVSIWGGQLDFIRTVFIKSRGNNFQVSFGNNVIDQTFKIHGYTVSGKESTVKNFTLS
jgi:hypothetical protein